MRTFSLRAKLSAAFLLVTLVLFLITMLLANGLLEGQFKAYVMNRQEQRNRDIVALITSRYNQWGGRWDVDGIEVLGVNAMGEGLLLRVMDTSGATVWDAAVHNNGMCKQIIAHMAQNMQSHRAGFSGGYVEEQFPITVGGSAVGTVDVGYYGPYFYSDNDLQFLATLNRLLKWAAAFSALLAALAGAWMARHIARPITSVVGAAERISQGDYHAKIAGRSGTTEIDGLSGAINSLADSLDRQETIRKRLTADVAHELRTPLATLLSHLEAMIDGVWEPEERRLKSCHEEVVRITKLVQDLENLTDYESESLTLEKAPVDLGVLLQRCVTNFESQYAEKGIELSLTAGDVALEADEDKLSQVFINLLSNALKYTPEGGKVCVRMEECDGSALVEVSDTGYGIEPEELPFIFERLYRTDKSRNRQTGGSGIGLSIAKAIVAAHGGSIGAQSVPGQGSCFTVTLPL